MDHKQRGEVEEAVVAKKNQDRRGFLVEQEKEPGTCVDSLQAVLVRRLWNGPDNLQMMQEKGRERRFDSDP